MLLNRKMEIGLENLYKQGKVVGGVYFGLGQEACSCASAYALDKDDWFAPMIRNQGALLVRGFGASDTMMQYMAKADSPTKGRDGTSHFGDIEKRNMVSPISMLGDLIPVLSGVALGARLQGRNIAALTWIGDGGQSTGVTYEGINFAAVQNLGLVLFVESNLWAYSTPSEMQYQMQRFGRTRHRIRHSGSDRRRHRRLPGLRRRPRRRRACPSRRRPHADRSQNDAHERPRHPRRRGVCAQADVRFLEEARSDCAV
jgi:TPP-dependent pyruvate/acetoin dehydrogenase alpha subunit